MNALCMFDTSLPALDVCVPVWWMTAESEHVPCDFVFETSSDSDCEADDGGEASPDDNLSDEDAELCQVSCKYFHGIPKHAMF